MSAATVVDVSLVRRLLAQRRPMAEIERLTGATAETIERVYRAFPPVVEKTAAGLSKWDPHREKLKALHAEGKTAAQAAGFFGVSRNAIIGVWSRMGLRSDAPSIHRTPQQIENARLNRLARRNENDRIKRASRRHADPRRTQGSILSAILAKQPAEPIAMQDDDVTLPTNLVPILARDADGKLTANPALTETCCRWWVGDPMQPGAGFCPEKKVDGLSYCQAHSVRAYAPPKVRSHRVAPAAKPERIPTFADAESE